jgi:hypothetical protein
MQMSYLKRLEGELHYLDPEQAHLHPPASATHQDALPDFYER